MKNMLKHVCISIFSVGVAVNAFATQLPGSMDPILLPNNATSADNLKLSLLRQCSAVISYAGDAYRVSMSQNRITVTLGELQAGLIPGVCPPSPRDEIDLGRLPAGNYTISVIKQAFAGSPSSAVVDNAPFVVTDGRAVKVTPYVRLDYSGHWWDPNDSGWGLFIWHDAKDNVLAACFTYGTDGKPIWWVFQPRWDTFAATLPASLMQTSRSPGATSPPSSPTVYSVVGTASLDFTNFGTGDDGKIAYSVNGGPQLVRNIQRFKP